MRTAFELFWSIVLTRIVIDWPMDPSRKQAKLVQIDPIPESDVDENHS